MTVCLTAPAEQRFQSSVPGGIQIVTMVEGQRTTGTPSVDGQRDVPWALTIPIGSKSADKSVKSRFLHDRSDKCLFEDSSSATSRTLE